MAGRTEATSHSTFAAKLDQNAPVIKRRHAALLQRFPKTKIASIGPETTRTLAALNVKPSAEAKEHTIDGLVGAIVQKSL